jgi:hypothetical protein
LHRLVAALLVSWLSWPVTAPKRPRKEEFHKMDWTSR